MGGREGQGIDAPQTKKTLGGIESLKIWWYLARRRRKILGSISSLLKNWERIWCAAGEKRIGDIFSKKTPPCPEFFRRICSLNQWGCLRRPTHNCSPSVPSARWNCSPKTPSAPFLKLFSGARCSMLPGYFTPAGFGGILQKPRGVI